MKCENTSYIVYILRCSDGTLYTGITNDLEKRIDAHNSGKGAKYTAGRAPVKLVYSEEAGSVNDALKREHEIKSLNRYKKEELIQGTKKNRNNNK
ncbi:MAG: GIY-YIG nuclease family protein [Acidobacteria bacterium]|nr:GIY-YIG nuclease family protein [Acidobacteriota bacterium]